jgi:predicted nucleotidyltransferase
MKTVAEITFRLKAVKPILLRNGIERIGLFGSVMRGEGRKKSDLDVLLHFRSGCENSATLIMPAKFWKLLSPKQKLMW